MCQDINFRTELRAKQRKEYFESIEREKTESMDMQPQHHRRHSSCANLLDLMQLKELDLDKTFDNCRKYAEDLM